MSYDPLSGLDRDLVRLLIRDTSGDSSTERLIDDEIDLILTNETATGAALPYYAAARALQSIVSGFLQEGEGVLSQKTGLYNRTEYGFSRDSVESVVDMVKELRTRGAELEFGRGRSGLGSVSFL